MSSRLLRWSIGLLLLAIACCSLLVFLASLSGHPPFTGIGIAILPVSFVVGFICLLLGLGAFWKRA